MKKQFTILLLSLLIFSQPFFIKSVFAVCINPADLGVKPCGERELYEIDKWYATQKADLRQRGLAFGGAAIKLDNEYQQKIAWCLEDNDTYIRAWNDYEECLEREAQQCTSYNWFCGSWSSCQPNGTQTRTCDKLSNCEGGMSSPPTTQSCIYVPTCSADTWKCGDWGTCSPQGIQTRSCNKTYDCPSAETAAPVTSQYCVSIPSCALSNWFCTDWGACLSNGEQTRICTKISNCQGGVSSPATTQSCLYTSCPLSSTPISNQCVCNEGYIMRDNSCITYTDDCKREYGENVYGVKGDNNNSSCFCNFGYEWNNERTACVEQKQESPVQELIIPNSSLESKDELNNEGEILGAEIDMRLANKLKGKLLLQVEDRGRIWYVNPDDAQKHEVTFANALPLFQKFALGITNKDLNGVPLNNENWASAIGNRLKGKLLLQVEDKGRIWYVDFNGKKWEVTWANLMTLFQKLALGITNADLGKIQSGSL